MRRCSHTDLAFSTTRSRFGDAFIFFDTSCKNGEIHMYLSDFVSRLVIVQRVAVVGCPIEKPGSKKSQQHDAALSAFNLESNYRAEIGPWS